MWQLTRVLASILVASSLIGHFGSASNQAYFDSLFNRDMLRSQHGIYVDHEHLVYVMEVNGALIRCNLAQCDVFGDQEQQLLTDYPIADISNLYTGESGFSFSDGSSTQCSTVCQTLDREKNKHSDTLLVFTTCNHLDMTAQSLQTLKHAPDSFDILVVDDHSVDGTPGYLMKKGFSVVSKDTAQGLTHSWNIGYRIAKLLRYRYVVFSNNDVLVPHGTIDITRQSLLYEPLVVPLTTKRGAGHNPTQSIALSYSLNPRQMQFVNNAANFQIVQNILTGLRASTVIYSWEAAFNQIYVEELCKVQRFFFAVNMELISPSAYDEENLFDPGDIMVAQEDSLMLRMIKNDLFPKICRYAFVYHYKSVTVKASNFVIGSRNETRNDLSHYHPELVDSLRSSVLDKYQSPYKDYDVKLTLPSMVMYTPHSQKIKVIAFALPRNDKSLLSSDTTAAVALSRRLATRFNVYVKYLYKGSDWYDLRDVDYLISFVDAYEIYKVQHAQPSLIAIAWIRNNLDRWLSRKYIGNYDIVLAPSLGAVKYLQSFKDFPMFCGIRCPPLLQYAQRRSPVIVRLFRHATERTRFTPNAPSDTFSADYIFIEQWHKSERENSTHSQILVDNYKGAIVARNKWMPLQPAHAGSNAVAKTITTEDIPKIYRSTKLVVEILSGKSVSLGVTSGLLDALACNTLVITNGLLGNAEVFQSILPTYSTLTESASVIRNYLTNENKRYLLANKLRRAVTKYHTYAARAMELDSILSGVYQNLDSRSTQGMRVSDTQYVISGKRSRQSVCIGLRTARGYEQVLEKFIVDMLQQYSLSPLQQSFYLNLYILRPHTASSQYTEVLRGIVNLTSQRKSDGAKVSLFYDPFYNSNRRELDSEDDIDQFLYYFKSKDECDWIMITETNNYGYYSTWMTKIFEKILGNTKPAYAWGFVPFEGSPEQLSLTAEELSNEHARNPHSSLIDSAAFSVNTLTLGGVIFQWDSIKYSTSQFMSFDPRRESLFDRDQRIIKSLLGRGQYEDIYYSHEVLMVYRDDDSRNSKSRNIFSFFG